MHRALQAAIREFTGDAQARVAVVAGSGLGHRLHPQSRRRRASRLSGLDFDTKNVVATSGKPVIAAMQGHCVGGSA